MKILKTLLSPVITAERSSFANGICDWSSDGKHFAWSCGNNFVQLIQVLPSSDEETFSWSLVKTINTRADVCSIAFGHQTPRMKESFCNNGRYRHHVFEDVLATGHSNGRIRAWDIGTGALKLELMDHKSSVLDLHFAPDHVFAMVSASCDGTIKFWDFNNDGNMCKTIRSGLERVVCCRWSHDARHVALGGSGSQVTMWRVKDYKLVRTFYGHVNHVTRCNFSPDGTMLASSSRDTRVIVWNISTADVIVNFLHLLPKPSPAFAGGENGAHVTDVSFSPNNISLVSVCETGVVYHWSMESPNQPVDKISIEGAHACRFSRDGQYVCAGSNSGRVMVILPQVPPLSLKQMCRNAIRRNVPLNGLSRSAVLPKPLQNYVLFA